MTDRTRDQGRTVQKGSLQYCRIFGNLTIYLRPIYTNPNHPWSGRNELWAKLLLYDRSNTSGFLWGASTTSHRVLRLSCHNKVNRFEGVSIRWRAKEQITISIMPWGSLTPEFSSWKSFGLGVVWLQILLSIMLIEKDGNDPSATAAKERFEQGYEVLSLYASDVN